MISSVDVKDQKMPARSIGGLQPEEEQVDLPLEDGLVPHSDVVGHPGEEAGLLGGGRDNVTYVDLFKKFIKLCVLLKFRISSFGGFS